MKEYNAAFFGLFENFLKELIKEFGQEKAIELFSKVMRTGLSNAYGKDFVRGNTQEFVRLIKERDNNVGLRVNFPLIQSDKLIYQFLDDPFPNLKGIINPSILDQTYMDFKVKTILGNEWKYVTTKHIWNGDDCTEHLIEKI